MKYKELKPCPYCGVNDAFIHNYNIEDSRWCLDHYCGHDEDELSIVINIYGKSREEVIERWNRRAKRKVKDLAKQFDVEVE